MNPDEPRDPADTTQPPPAWNQPGAAPDSWGQQPPPGPPPQPGSPPPGQYPPQQSWGATGQPSQHGAPPPAQPSPEPGPAVGQWRPPAADPRFGPSGQPATSKTNVLAIASLVTAFFCSPVGVVLGVIALQQIKQRNEGGSGLAIAGIVIGVVATLLSCVFFSLVPADTTGY